MDFDQICVEMILALGCFETQQHLFIASDRPVYLF